MFTVCVHSGELQIRVWQITPDVYRTNSKHGSQTEGIWFESLIFMLWIR